MIHSSADILRILTTDPVIAASVSVRIIEGRVPLADEGAWIYIANYPTVDDGIADWRLWIVDFDGDLLEDVIVSKVQNLLPSVRVISSTGLLELSTSYLASPATVTKPELSTAPGELTQTIPTALQQRLDEALERLEDQSLLRPKSGKDGAPGPQGPAGPSGRDGRDGRDLVATEANLDDLNDVDVLDPEEGQVLMFKGGRWQNLYVPKNISIAGGGGGGGSAPPQTFNKWEGMPSNAEDWVEQDETGHLLPVNENQNIGSEVLPVKEIYVGDFDNSFALVQLVQTMSAQINALETRLQTLENVETLEFE